MDAYAVTLDAATYRAVKLAARFAGVSEAEVVATAIMAYSADSSIPVTSIESMGEVAIYATYLGTRVEATFDAASDRVTITSGELRGETFGSPSAAAAAVVRAINPSRDPHVNGWRFWKVTATRRLLETLR